MKNSKATEEIREIRDRLSLRLQALTPEERSKEFQEAIDNFERASGKHVVTADYSRSSKTRAEDVVQV
jgi:tRNA A37 methylthiotransferase MiaB